MGDETTLSASSGEGGAPSGAVLPVESQRQKSWGVAVVVVCALLALFWPRSEHGSAPPGTLVDSRGHQVKLSSYMGPVTLVHFWATWCAPCMVEVPSILRLSDDYSGNHNFSLVMIAVQDDIEKVTGFLGDQVSVSLFDHEWKVSKRYGTHKLPETHLVVGGKVIETFIGATNWDLAETRRRIDEALAAQVETS